MPSSLDPSPDHDPFRRDPFVAILEISLPEESNQWLKGLTDKKSVSVFMEVDGGPRHQATTLENNADNGVDPFVKSNGDGSAFYFVVDRSHTILRVSRHMRGWES